LILCLTCVATAAAQQAEPRPEPRAKWTVEGGFKVDRPFYLKNKGEKFYVVDDFSLEEPGWKEQGSIEASIAAPRSSSRPSSRNIPSRATCRPPCTGRPSRSTGSAPPRTCARR